MEFTKIIATAPIAPTAPPSYDHHHSHSYQNETFQRQTPTQSAYPHPQPTVTAHNAYPTQNQSGFYPPYQRPGQVVITQAPTTIVKPPGMISFKVCYLYIRNSPNLFWFRLIRLRFHWNNSISDFTNSIEPLRDHPSITRCMRCNTQIMTNVEYYNSTITHCVGGILCLTAWYCCCCFLPYCFKGTKNVRHYCPQCKTLIGSYDRKMC